MLLQAGHWVRTDWQCRLGTLATSDQADLNALVDPSTAVQFWTGWQSFKLGQARSLAGSQFGLGQAGSQFGFFRTGWWDRLIGQAI